VVSSHSRSSGPDGDQLEDGDRREPTMTLASWRRFIDTPPAAFELLPEKQWLDLAGPERDRYEDARITYHSEMIVVATSLIRQVARQGRLLTGAARIGSYFDVGDGEGATYRVTLVKVIDPAQGADQFTTPDSGKRFVGAVFRITALNGSPQDEDANNDAALVGSDGQAYSADFDAIAGYTNFDNGQIQVAQGDSEIGAVTFQVPDGVKVAEIQWTGGGFGSAVQWDVRG